MNQMNPKDPTRQVPVAIVGMSVLLPGAPDLRTYWTNLVEGRDAITDVPPRRWDARYYEPNPDARRPDQIYCRRGGFVDDLAVAEPERFGITEAEAATIDPEQLIALGVAAAAIDDAGGPGRLGDLGRVGVVLGRGGYMSPGLVRHDQRVRTARQLVHTLGSLLPSLGMDELERVREAFTDALGPQPGGSGSAEAALGLVPNLTASRIANRLDLRGPAYTVDAACASSLIAVDAAAAELAGGRCDAVLAGGVHHCHDITLWSLFSQLGALSTSQRSRPFHADADGLLVGEGTGVVVLKRLDDAVAAGDRIYAVIRGTGVASDGHGGITEPEPAGQAAAIERAWAAAGLDPRQPDAVGLIEAHGAGTPAADAAELAALERVFGPAGADNLAVIGSVKSMIGHAMPAAGVAGLVKAALAVHHGVLLATLNCEQPHPAMERTRFRPLTVASPWVASGPRRAGVNAFGFGGINAHVLLEQAPDTGTAPAWTVAGADAPGLVAAQPAAAPIAPATVPITQVSVTEPERVLRFAAPNPEALIEQLEGDDAELRERGSVLPTYLGPGSRLGLVGPTERRLAVARKVARGSRSGGWASWRGRNDVWLSSEPLLSPTPGRIAFVFPGLEAEFSPRVDDVTEHFGFPRLDLSSDGIGQHGSAVLRIGRILERALRRMGVVPDALAGHSVGEWNAMFASGMFDESAADDVVFGPVMDDLAALDVDYASLACPLEQAMEAISGYPEIVLSHDNAPQQTIVCGPPDAIRALAAEQRRNNVLVQVLPFRSGFHTPKLAPYMAEIGRLVAASPIVRGPRTELWSATLVDRYPDAPEQIRGLVLRHLVEPVRFRPMILAMYSAGVRVFVQVGQGRLGGLIDDTLGFVPHLTVAANTARRSGLDQLRRVAVALWVEGGVPDFSVLETAPSVTALRARMSTVAPATPVAHGSATPVAHTPVNGSATAARRAVPETGVPVDAAAAGRNGGPRRTPARLPLDLGTGLVTLDPAVLPFPAGDPGSATTRLAGWARRDPVAHELLGLLADTAQTAVAALESTAGPEPEGTSGAGQPAAGRRDWLDPAGAPEEEPGPAPIESLENQLRISMETMPFLIDHCLAPQRRGWPEVSDLRPVVPATTIVRLMMDLAEKAAPGRVAVGLSEVRFDRWLPAAPPTDANVGVQPIGPDSVAVTFGEYARAIVRLADRYPDANRPLWPHEGSHEEPPALSGPELYGRRWMFHGPKYQGVISLLGHSDTHARAILTPTTAPGSLLDAAGQVLAYFARVNLPDRYVIIPAAIDRVDIYGPEPAPGTPVNCLAWVPWHDQDWLTAHFQLVADGRVWAEVSGWLDRRFDVRPETDEVFRFPELNTVGRQMPGGWMLIPERWGDLATRDMFAGRYLGAAERAELQRQLPRDRRGWLLERIAVKDAVRARLWESGSGPVFPAELRVTADAGGGVTVTGEHGLDLPPLRVAVSHGGEVAVALVRPGDGAGAGTGLGIDVEEVRDHPQATVEAVLTPAERDLVADLVRRTGSPAARWFAGLLAAKEAAARSAGTNLGDAPQRFVVTGAVAGATDRLTVTLPSGDLVEVAVTGAGNPPDLPEREYVIAWTDPLPGTDPGTGTNDTYPGETS